MEEVNLHQVQVPRDALLQGERQASKQVLQATGGKEGPKWGESGRSVFPLLQLCASGILYADWAGTCKIYCN